MRTESEVPKGLSGSITCVAVCGVVWRCVVWRGMMWFGMVWRGVVWHGVA